MNTRPALPESSPGAPGEVVRFGPGVEQRQRLAKAKLASTLLLDEALMQKMFGDSGNQAGAGLGSGHEFALSLNAVPVRQQAPDDAGTLADKCVPRLQLALVPYDDLFNQKDRYYWPVRMGDTGAQPAPDEPRLRFPFGNPDSDSAEPSCDNSSHWIGPSFVLQRESNHSSPTKACND